MTPNKKTPVEIRKEKRQMFAVKVGVYIAILAGVICQNIVSRFNPHELILDMDIGGMTVARFVVALVVATAIYWRIDGQAGELRGKAKNVGRVLTLGFTSGFTLMGIAGIGE